VQFFRAILMILTIPVLAAGCATSQATMPGEVYDPWEPYNRSVFDTFLVIDRNAFRPAAEAWRNTAPEPVRRSVRNFLLNLDTPDILMNDVLRGRIEPAGTTLIRGLINSTAGIGGLFEVAEGLGFPRHSDDFGKTLAEYGAGSGPYLFLILFGPSNVRDLAGIVVDLAFNPVLLIGAPAGFYALTGDVGLKALDRRELNLELWDDLRRSSADFYATIRDGYTQSRNSEIRQELGGKEELPEF
jgi:phospholipid-binding lipoprotein MlaA